MQVAKLWPAITFTPLSYGDTAADKRMLAIAEYSSISSDAWIRFKNNFFHFCFYEVTASEAKDLCNEWHSPPEGEEFTLHADGFTIVDNRT